MVEVWPENAQAFLIFSSLQTQWQIGMAGPTGLRYEALYPLLDRAAKDNDEWQQLFEDIRIIEAGALSALHRDK